VETLEALKSKLEIIQKKLDKLNNSDSYLDQVKNAFHLGMVGGSGNRKNLNKLNQRRERSIDKSIEHAKQYIKLSNEKELIMKQIEFIESGRKERQETIKQIMREQVLAAQVDDIVIDSSYGECRIVRVNMKSLTIETASGYKEARPFNLIIGVKKKAIKQ